MLVANRKLEPAKLTDSVRELLAEGQARAFDRAKSSFDLLSGSAGSSIVLFGAGNLGRKTLAGLRTVGREPLIFVDSDPRLWNTSVDGLRVLSPEQGAALYGATSTFVITIWTGGGHDRMAQRDHQLRVLGCQRVVPFTALFWKFSEIFLPHYAVDLPHKVHEQAKDVVMCCEVWSDDASRREYLAQLRWRLFSDFDSLPDPVRHTIYFPPDLCRLTDREVFVDCGAYDGDTVRSFVEQSKSPYGHIFAFEPDPENFRKLQRTADLLSTTGLITAQQAATGAHRGTISFCARGDEASCVTTGQGDTVVNCITLDEALKGANPTYIKMDIEGAELDALRGASGLIRSCSPVLAICSYHRQDHLWRIPLLIRSFSNKYRFYLRPHLLEVWDLVCYAIPQHRAL